MFSFYFLFFHYKIQNGVAFSCLHVQIDIGAELQCDLKPQKQRSENVTVVKTIESDEIVGHEIFAQVLAPMMRSGEIASIDAVSMGEQNAPEFTWVLIGGIYIS